MKASLNYFAVFFLAFILMSCSDHEKKMIVFPGESWKTQSPESQGIDSGKLDDALAVLRSFCGKDGTDQTLIVRNGYIIWQGPNTQKANNVYSTSKSFTSTVLGLLIQEDQCQLNDFAYHWEPALNIEPYRHITLRHFTTMTSGYNAKGDTRWDEVSKDWSWAPYDPGEPIFLPGERYCYWDEAQMMFGRVLTRIAGMEIKQVFDQNIGSTIGMGHFEWGTEGTIGSMDINNGCTGVKVNAHQLARFGWLFLNNGNWDGKQLISSEWVKEATSVQVPESIPVADTDRKSTNGSGSYGYNWWINAGASAMPESPNSLYYASGFNNNMCFVIPEWQMVIVRMGLDGNPREPKHITYNRFFKALKEAVVDL